MFEISDVICELPVARAVVVAALAFVVAACSVVIGGGAARADDCQITSEGRICKVKQPINAGAVVSTATQRELGLVTVNGGCSGTLITQFLVLTARHCITENGLIDGPLNFSSRVTITAVWTSTRAVVTSIQDFKGNNAAPHDDIILLRLGWPNFGDVPTQRIFATGRRGANNSIKLSYSLITSDVVTQYGRGFSTFASGTFGMASARPSSGSIYRSAQFSPVSITDRGYDLKMNGSSQVGHGGDSGGPTVVTVNGFAEGVAGVQSTCRATGYIPGTPANQQNWTWATGISDCHYVATARYRDQIEAAKKEKAPLDNRDLCKKYAARQFAKIAEARRLDCPFLKGSGGWNQEEAAFEKSCLGFKDSAASTIPFNESGLQRNMDSCKSAKGLTITVGKVCMDYAEMMVQKGKKVVGTKCEPLSNFKPKEVWFQECNEGFMKLPGRLPYDMNQQAQMYEGNLQNCLLSLKADPKKADPKKVATAAHGTEATAVHATDMYPDNSGKSKKKCTMNVNDKGTLLGTKRSETRWLNIAGTSGKCKGETGWVWQGDNKQDVKLN